MNAVLLKLRFWEIIHYLVIKEDLRLVHIGRNGDEVWIEDDRKEPFQLIRLSYKELDWSNELRADIKQTYQRGKQLRKQIGLRSANIVNVILSVYAPVDDYSELVDKPVPLSGRGKNEQRTILLTLQNLREQLFPLATEWRLKEMPDFTVPEQLEDEEAIVRVLKSEVQRASDTRHEKEKGLFFYGKPILTYLILGVILAVFTIVEMYGSSTSPETLINFGAKFNPLIYEGEWWRFFSAMFLHIGVFHLLMNSLALFYLGGAVERIFGTARFFFIYGVAGLTGSVASFAFNEQVSAGASGAIFGCFGALLYFGVKHKRLFFRTMGMNVIVILLINLGIGFMVPMVDNGAHIGGLVGGFAASAVMGLPKHKNRRRLLSLGLLAAGLGALLFYGYSQELTGQSYAAYLQTGIEYIQNDEPEEAKTYFEAIIEADIPNHEIILTDAYFWLAYIQANEGELAEAEENLLRTLERDPMFHEAHFNLALIYYERGDYEKAYVQLEEALQLQPESDAYNQLESELSQYID